MSEHGIIHDTSVAITVSRLKQDLAALGLCAGDTVMVHASLRSLGWVCGGAQAVIQALLDSLGPGGTLVMPTHTNGLTDPATWEAPPVPEAWWEAIRDEMPAYDPVRSPTRDMGAIPELFRSWPGVVRSVHPNFSVAAHGPQAVHIAQPHAPDDPFGPDSPYARLYDLDARILMLGTAYDTCTMLHLAERRSHEVKFTIERAPMLVEAQRQWVKYRVHQMDSDRFPDLAPVLDGFGLCVHGQVGRARARLLHSRAAIDSALDIWIDKKIRL